MRKWGSASRRAGRWVLVLPLAALVTAVLVAPSVVGLWKSFHASSIYEIQQGFTLENWTHVVQDPTFWAAWATSLTIGGTTALMSVGLGFWLAHFMRFTRPQSAQLVFAVLLVALVGGYLVRIYAWRTLLGDSGVINAVLIRSGMTHAPVQGLLFSPLAVFLALGSIYLPYATLMISAGLANVGDDEVEAARDLGASAFDAYRGVVVPLAGGAIFRAFVLIFLLSAADYVIPQLVGGAHTQMVGELIYTALVSGGDAGAGAATAFVSMILFGLAIAILGLFARAAGLLSRTVAS
ncbi:ABC transporter permease [Nocardioides sp. AN3]